MKKEFGYPYFNGYFAKIKLGLGDKTYVGTQDEFLALTTSKKIPTKGVPDMNGKTLAVNTQTKTVNRD